MHTFSKPLRQKVFADSGGHCWYCGKKTRFPDRGGTSGDMFTLDHVIPQSKGGTHKLDNLVACCFSCNSAKRDLTLEEYRTAILRRWGALFTTQQIKYWEERGVELPAVAKIDVPVFFGESK